MTITRKADRPVETVTGPRTGPGHLDWLGNAGGLTQFGAVIETLPPGSRSSIKHWHAAEDELVYMLEGQATVILGDATHLLDPGDVATFKAGVPLGHCIENRTASDIRYLVVGTRSAADVVTYPDDDRILHRDADGQHWTDAAGVPAKNPYRG